MDTIRFERVELYSIVWKDALSVVAANHNVTAKGLVAACKALDVPLPRKGHWTRVYSGERISCAPLPPLVAGAPEHAEVELRPTKVREESPRIVIDLGERELTMDLVVASRRTLELGHAGSNGIVVPPKNRRTLGLQVTPGQLARGLRIWDAVCRDAPTVGATIEVVRTKEGASFDTWVRIDGESFRIVIEEQLRRSERPPPPKKDPKDWRFTLRISGQDRYTYEPTGKLSLRFLDLDRVGGRKKFEDSPTQRLESKLPDVIAALPKAAIEIKAHREAQAQLRERHRQAEIVRIEEQKREREHNELVGQLFQMKKHWRAAEELRAFVSAAEALVPEDARDEAWREWISWARWYASAIDPLSSAVEARGCSCTRIATHGSPILSWASKEAGS